MTRRFGTVLRRLNETCAPTIHRLEQDTHVLLCRATGPEYAPKSPVAVLEYLYQHGIECDLSRQINVGSRKFGISTLS